MQNNQCKIHRHDTWVNKSSDLKVCNISSLINLTYNWTRKEWRFFRGSHQFNELTVQKVLVTGQKAWRPQPFLLISFQFELWFIRSERFYGTCVAPYQPLPSTPGVGGRTSGKSSVKTRRKHLPLKALQSFYLFSLLKKIITRQIFVFLVALSRAKLVSSSDKN